jgi:Polysaccharide deacetylase
MHPTLKRLCYSAVATLNTGSLQKMSPVEVIIPYHHLVSDEPVPYIQSLYAFKNSRQFEADLDYLLRNFQALTLPEVIQRQREQECRLEQQRFGLERQQRQQEQLPRWQQPGRQNNPSRKEDSPPRKKGFLICFDDGLRQVYEIAAPILLRKGVPAALFINPAFVDNKEIFYSFQKGWLLHRLGGHNEAGGGGRGGSPGEAGGSSLSRILGSAAGRTQLLRTASQLFGRPLHTITQLLSAIRSINYLNRHLVAQLGSLLGFDPETDIRDQRPFMTLDQLKELSAKGFAIGAHSMDHPLYSLISRKEQISQTLRSVRWVSDNFNQPFKAFAFPHVDTGVGHDFFRRLVPGRDDQSPLLVERMMPPPNEELSSVPNEQSASVRHEQSPPPGDDSLDLILGNSTGMLERHPMVLHRFIGENPAIPIERMVKGVMAYSIMRKYTGRSFVRREE